MTRLQRVGKRHPEAGSVRLGMVARVEQGAVGEAAFRDALPEEFLEGRPANAESARLFADACMDAVRRAIPARHSLPYMQHAVLGLAYDAWNTLRLCDRGEPP